MTLVVIQGVGLLVIVGVPIAFAYAATKYGFRKVAVFGCLPVLGGIAAVVAAAFIAYKLAYPTYTYRYRMTVEVDTPEGPRSASSVIQAELMFQPKIGQGPPVRWHVVGEAVYLDLGNGKNAIALLAGGPNGDNVDYRWHVLFHAFKIDGGNHDMLSAFQTSIARGVLTPDHYPTFITFTDFSDPTSARIVAPQDFADVFGAGFAVRAITVEMTQDFVTRKIEEKIPQIINYLREKNKTMQITSIGDSFASRLRLGHLYIGD